MNSLSESEAPLTEAVHLKISAPLYRALKRLAEKQDCSFNHLAKKLLELGVRGESEYSPRANGVLS
jgi:predicted HicB family RNase H-like nuclease